MGDTKTTSKTETKSTDVELVKARKQWLSTTVEIGGHTFTGNEPTAVPASDVDALLEARDPDGRPYVERAKPQA